MWKNNKLYAKEKRWKLLSCFLNNFQLKCDSLILKTSKFLLKFQK